MQRNDTSKKITILQTAIDLASTHSNSLPSSLTQSETYRLTINLVYLKSEEQILKKLAESETNREEEKHTATLINTCIKENALRCIQEDWYKKPDTQTCSAIISDLTRQILQAIKASLACLIQREKWKQKSQELPFYFFSQRPSFQSIMTVLQDYVDTNNAYKATLDELKRKEFIRVLSCQISSVSKRQREENSKEQTDPRAKRLKTNNFWDEKSPHNMAFNTTENQDEALSNAFSATPSEQEKIDEEEQQFNNYFMRLD